MVPEGGLPKGAAGAVRALLSEQRDGRASMQGKTNDMQTELTASEQVRVRVSKCV